MSERADGDVFEVTPDPWLSDIVEPYIEMVRLRVLDAAALLVKGDFRSIRRFAHNTKGTGGGYGLPELTRRATELERAAIAADAVAVDRALASMDAYLAAVRIVSPDQTAA